MSFWKIFGIALLAAVALMLVVILDLVICYGIMCLTGLPPDTVAYDVVCFVLMFLVTAALMSFVTWLAIKIDGRR